jgi:Sec-independent protein translocase protein TatA
VRLRTEILFTLMLGLLVLGPKQMHTLLGQVALGHVARAKTQFEEASRGFKSQFAAELDARHQEGESDASHELAGDQ